MVSGVRITLESRHKLSNALFDPAHAELAAFHPASGKACTNRARQDVQSHLASPPAAFDPNAGTADQAANERAPERSVPEVVRDEWEEARQH